MNLNHKNELLLHSLYCFWGLVIDRNFGPLYTIYFSTLPSLVRSWDLRSPRLMGGMESLTNPLIRPAIDVAVGDTIWRPCSSYPPTTNTFSVATLWGLPSYQFPVRGARISDLRKEHLMALGCVDGLGLIPYRIGMLLPYLSTLGRFSYAPY